MGPSPDKKEEVPAAAPLLRVKERTSPAATLLLRAKSRTCQRHNSFFAARSAAARGATPSRNRERLAPAAQPLPGEKKFPAPAAQLLLGEKKQIFLRRKPFSENLAARCTCHDLLSTRKRGRASGDTRLSSRDRVAPAAQPVLGIEKALRRLEESPFLPGKGSRQTEIANLDTENEISRSQHPLSVPRRSLAAAHLLVSTRKSSLGAGKSPSRHEKDVGRNAPGVLDSKKESRAWRRAEADSLYMTEDAFPKATGTKDKELFKIEGATHIETYWVPKYVEGALGKMKPFFARTL
jgi:hypothetical protein